MTHHPRFLDQTSKLTSAQLVVLMREPMATIATIGFPTLTVIVLASVFGKLPDPDFGGVAPTDHYFAGYIAVVIAAMGLITLSTHAASDRELGVSRRLRASGVSAPALVASHVAVGTAFATAAIAIIVIVGRALYGLTAPRHPVAVVLWTVAGLICFTSIGLALGSLSKTARAATAIGNLVFLPMLLLGGGGPPRAVMTGPLRTISDVLPLTHIIGGLRHAWLGHTDDPRALWWPALIALVAGAAALHAERRRAD